MDLGCGGSRKVKPTVDYDWIRKITFDPVVMGMTSIHEPAVGLTDIRPIRR